MDEQSLMKDLECVSGASKPMTVAAGLAPFVRRWNRVLASHATPHEIALGCAIGIFAAFTPFLGFQMLLAVILAVLLRVNVPAALAGTFAGNPLSWPAIWAGSYLAGSWVLGLDPVRAAGHVGESASLLAAAAKAPNSAVLDAAAHTLAPHVKPLLTGSLLTGLIVSALSYYPLRRAAVRVQRRRRRR